MTVAYLTTRAGGDTVRRHRSCSESAGGRALSGGGQRDGDGGDICDGKAGAGV